MHKGGGSFGNEKLNDLMLHGAYSTVFLDGNEKDLMLRVLRLHCN